MNSRNTLLPVGFRFRPTDEELVSYFLSAKINGDHIIQDGKIKDIDIYEYEPMELYDPDLDDGDGRMYFFTPLHKICPNGQRAKRVTKQGFWRASQKSTNVLDQMGNIIGTKMSLVYYFQNSTPPKTSWLMSEYRLPKENTPFTQVHDPFILERYALCVVYDNKRSKTRNICSNNECLQNEVPQSVESGVAPPFNHVSSPIPYSYPNLVNDLIASSSYPISNYNPTFDSPFSDPFLISSPNTSPFLHSYQNLANDLFASSSDPISYHNPTFDSPFSNPFLISSPNIFTNSNLNSDHVSTSNPFPSPK